VSSVELFRALFDVSEDLPGTGRNGDKKTGKGFVLKQDFAADEGVWIWERSRIAILSVNGKVGMMPRMRRAETSSI
jgi:hypothetical protein